jgi:HlyD family secretion protein
MLRHRMYLGLVLIQLFLALVGCAGGKGEVTPTIAAATATAIPSVVSSEASYTVERGRVARTLELNGRIAPVAETELSFAVAGYVKQVYVGARDQVHAGDVLAELEIGDLPAQIAQAEINLELANQALEDADAERAQAIALAELDLAMAQARLQSAKDANAYAVAAARLVLQSAQEQLASLQALAATHTAAVTSAQVALARAQEAQGRAQTEYNESLERAWETAEARDAYARELQAAKWAAQIAQAQYAQAAAEQESYQHELKVQGVVVSQAEAEVARLNDDIDPLLDLEVQRAQLAVDQAQRDTSRGLATKVAQAQLTLDQLQSQQDKGRIRSPVDGQVVSLSVYPGLLVEPLKPMIIVADPTAVEVRATAPAEQMVALTEGQSVSVSVGPRFEQTYEGVIRCLPYPYGTCGGSGEGADSDPAVRVSLGADSLTFQTGASATVTAILEVRDDVLWLPPEVIRTLQGQPFVTVQEGARQRRVEIEVGVRGDDRVEIVSGLEQGEVVVAP